jgi:hypothetical protein
MLLTSQEQTWMVAFVSTTYTSHQLLVATSSHFYSMSRTEDKMVRHKTGGGKKMSQNVLVVLINATVVLGLTVQS